ncbi:MAG: ATP-binding protein [Verrucomicrobia bacterium]|nr:ATP-binding protein [Verrucomicrobiota bacterium]
MSRHLGVKGTLALLEELRGAVSDFAAREQKLTQEFRVKTGVELRQFEAALEQENARLAAETAKADAEFQAKEKAFKAKLEAREARIIKAHRGATQQATARIEREEGQVTFTVQKGLLDTERNRKAELAANDTRLAEFQAAIAETRERFVALEQDAQRAFRGYGRFLKVLAEPGAGDDPDFSHDEFQLHDTLKALHGQTREALRRFRWRPEPLAFRACPLWLLLVLLAVAGGGAAPALQYFKIVNAAPMHVWIGTGVLAVLVVVLYFVGRSRCLPHATAIAQALDRARRLHNGCLEKAAQRHEQEIQRLEGEAKQRRDALNRDWTTATDLATSRRANWPTLMGHKAAMVTARSERYFQRNLKRCQQVRADVVARLTAESETRKQPLIATHERKLALLKSDHDARWQEMEAEWKGRLHPLFDTIRSANAAAEEFTEWRPELWANWVPPEKFHNAAKFGHLDVDLHTLAERVPQDPRLALPGPAKFSLPLVLTYPHGGSILLETSKSGSEAVADTLNNVILRLLAGSPPGKLSFTIIDPVKLGQNFAGVMHLADYEENLINNRIWTQTTEIEARLADLNEHMEKVIQMYLRNEYETIAEYNEQAGKIAEKYHFLVIADFPVNFSETAVRRLVNIAASGARCGVYTLIHWDRRQMLPPDFVLDELRKNSVCLSCPGGTFLLTGQPLGGIKLVLDTPPSPELTTEFLHTVGLAGKDANRVEVPFAHVAPAPSELWSLDTTEELRVPIGRTGATKLQYLSIGKGTRQHALFAGKTGSGKSTLFHVIITNLALWCRPEQVEFYLVDFKKGVEFKCYATHRLPHARVVAIESDREFGLSVLQRLDEELKRRGDLFRQLGVQDIAGYKRAGGAEPIPRALLIIDEFQEFFVEDDRVSQSAAVLLDRIVRQGRAFGIHVLLGSQTLGGAYTLARTTIGQMVIRVALQCNEADAYLIMDENNPAPRLLSRPGEGIYNDMAGTTEGNSPFQTVWLPDEERERRLEEIRLLAQEQAKSRPAPFVFEGNAPADVRDNFPLRTALEAAPAKSPASARFWLGAPNSIKGPTEAVFHRQSGNNLLIVGQREEAALAIVSVGFVSLAAQYPRGTARFVLFDSTPPGSPQRSFTERLTASIPHDLTVAKGGDLGDLLSGLVAEMKRRADEQHGADSLAVFLFIYGLQNFKKLRQEDDFSFSASDEAEANPAKLLGELITGGPAVGLHVIASCDTYNNVNRYLGRKALSEFEMRVLFQMSANDSASLIDNPKAGSLGLHRALFYNEQEGWLETFRPYALPGRDWVEEVARQLARRP